MVPQKLKHDVIREDPHPRERDLPGVAIQPAQTGDPTSASLPVPFVEHALLRPAHAALRVLPELVSSREPPPGNAFHPVVHVGPYLDA